MAILLLELNTFAHGISVFFIYAFWWHKPYDFATHVYIGSAHIRSSELIYNALDVYARDRSRNTTDKMFSAYDWEKAGVSMALIEFLAFLVYGAIHCLAREYPFPNTR
jgi:hypothetical protein